MAIPINRYVEITSNVGAGAALPERELITRIFTTNNLVPPGGEALEFNDAAGVGDYFGSTSEEYFRSLFYFGRISKNGTRAQKLSFSRWVNAAVAPRIYGEKKAQVVASWTSITDGSFKITISGVQQSFTGTDFTGATTLANIATILQTKIQTGTGTMFTAATVTWDAVRSSFDFVGGDTTATTNISVQIGTTGTDIAGKIGWISGDGLIFANGSAVETVSDALTLSAVASDNFGNFLFMQTLTTDELAEVAEWNNADNQKNNFMFLVPSTLNNASAISTALINYAGVGVTVQEASGEYAEMLPGIIQAATDYEAANSVQNYEFQQSALTPSVTTEGLADSLDNIRVNYYGLTQSAGRQLAFYQKGVLMGEVSTDAIDMNTYSNEQWLRSAAQTALMNLLLALSKVSANQEGRGQILGTLQDVINRALRNGTISVGKTLNTIQKLFISEESGDPNAWHQVQNQGYWVDCVIVQRSVGPSLQYEADYLLIYSKDDVIRKINGRHTLI